MDFPKGFIMSTTKVNNKNKEYIEKDSKVVNQVLARCAPIVAHRGQGSYVYDLNDEAYLDFTTGIAVTNTGHCHPKVVKAIQEQASKLMHTSVTTYHKLYIDLASKLVEITPDTLDSVFLANSGAEAVEGAVKLARYVTRKPAIINFRGSFHGRTLLTTALTTSKLYYRENYEPLPGSIYTIPYPYQLHSKYKDDAAKCVDDVFRHLDILFNQFVSPEQVACMIIEPILGEGGYVVPPDGFLKKIRKLCDEKNILLIIDEVQSGFGRSGKMFACEYEGIKPDIMLMAKGIASGMPLSAFITRKELADKWPSGRHGNTFGGNPVSCAAALATIEVIKEEKMVENASTVGRHMMARLDEIAKKSKFIAQVRGRGLMIGIEFCDENGKPSHDLAQKVIDYCFEHKLLVLSCGSFGQVIRLIPPINLSMGEADKGLEILEKAIMALH